MFWTKAGQQVSLGDGGINPSFHTSTNGEHSQDTNLESAMENLNESNHQLLQTIEELKAEKCEASTLHKYCRNILFYGMLCESSCDTRDRIRIIIVPIHS